MKSATSRMRARSQTLREPKEGSSNAVNSGLRGYVSAGEAQAYKKELETLRSQAADQVRAPKPSPPSSSPLPLQLRNETPIRLSARLKAGREPFLVSAIYHDDAFTYIKCSAREKPALYEIKDGKPNLISFQVENGVYIAPNIIDTGYLAVGQKNCYLRVAFPRTEEPTMNQPTQPTHVQEKAPKPQGLLPKNIQSWLLIGLAFSWSPSCG